MYFLIHSSWEDKSPLSALLEAGIKAHSIIELSRNSHFFIVDILIKDLIDEEPVWHSFFINTIENILSILDNNHIIDHKISLFPERHDKCSKNSFIVEQIIEVIAGEDNDGHKVYVYVGKNTIRILDSLSIQSENDMVNKRTIYRYGKKFNSLISYN